MSPLKNVLNPLKAISCGRVKAKSVSFGGLSGHDILCIDPGGVLKMLIPDDKFVPGELRAVHSPLGDCL